MALSKVDLDAAFQPLPPITWPGGGEVMVKPIAFRQQRVAAKIEKGEVDVLDALPGLVAELVPGKTLEEIETTLNVEQMWLVVHYACRNVERVQAYLEHLAGKSEAGPTPPSSPPTPSGTSSAVSPVRMPETSGVS